jgi:glycosyltransferase involved in cell wall biosynthesis
MSKALHIYYSSWVHESRAWRAGDLVLENGLVDEVVYVGHQFDGLPNETQRSAKETIVLLPPLLGSTTERRGERVRGLFRWWREIYARYRNDRDIRFIQAHSLVAMPVAALLKWKLRIPLLYDAHELETERDGWGERTKKIARVLERNLIWRADHTIVVGEAIRKWYARTYPGLALSLVRNIPVIPDARGQAGSLRKAFGISDDHLVCVYCGVISPSRGTKELIEIFHRLPPDKHMVFVGYGDDVEMLQRESAGAPNIHYHPAVPSHQVVDFIREADLGVIFPVSDSLSYRYGMPNKLFEYAAAGLSILCGDGDDMKAFVETHRIGWSVPLTVGDFVTTLDRIDRQTARHVAATADRNFPTSEAEHARLLDIIQGMLARR